MCLSSLKAPKCKLFRNAPNLSPSTAERGPGVLWFQADTAHYPQSYKAMIPRKYLLPTAGALQPKLKIAIPPSEMGQTVKSTDRNTELTI